MRISEHWLRRFVDPALSTQQLADRLTMAGLEVEDIEAAAPPFQGVVVAHVLEVTKHPDADKLRVCIVDAGETVAGEGSLARDGRVLRQIVCGAPNVAAGVKVPCALPGAELPGGMKIGLATMRGVESAGMLCSAKELGLSQDHAGLLLLGEEAAVGASVREHLALDDAILTLKLTPNLAHCLSVAGVAREVSALTGAPLALPSFAPVPVTLDDRLPVDVQAPDLCGRFSGRILRGVNARAATPDWMRARLERSGQRPVSALVDISNYVMLELGRPTHVFDLSRIEGGLQVRWAREGETLKLLNGQTVTLAADEGVICDGSGKPESLAGIMGGDHTAVTLDTTDIYLEAAFWWPRAIAGRARRHGFSSEASHRFERGVDPASTVEHLERISALVLEICGGRAAPVDDRILAMPAREPVTLRLSRAAKVIGMPLPTEAITGAFDRLGLAWTRLDDDRLAVTPPSWRFDIAIEEDLIEEAARLHGFDRLPVRPPVAPAAMRAQPEARLGAVALKRRFAARDWQEVLHFSFVDGRLDRDLGEGVAPIALLNPIAEQLDVMRTHLWAGLVGTLRHNLNRRATRVRIFELGKVFLRDDQAQAGPLAVAGIRQPLRFGGLAYGPAAPEQWGQGARSVDFFDVKADLAALCHPVALDCEAAVHPALHPGRSARLVLDGRAVGWLGELHPLLQQRLDLPHAPVLFELDAEALMHRPLPAHAEIPRFPPAVRDLAFVVDDVVPAGRLLAEIREECAANPALQAVREVSVFDEYRGKGLENKEKSIAIRFRLQDTRRTLNDEEVDAALAAVVARLQRVLQARLRA